MVCPKCNSDKVQVSVNTYTVSTAKRSFGRDILWCCLTGGLWLIWILIRKPPKDKVVREKTAVCSGCAHSWVLDE